MAVAKLLVLFLLIPFVCQATDLKPWFGNDYETEVRATLLYQNYNKIDTPVHHHTKSANDLFATLSAAYPFRRFCGEFEITGAHTRHQKSGWDNTRLTGRYQWAETPLSAVAGLTFTLPCRQSLEDISSFHNGYFETEATLAYGQKFGGCPCTNDYFFRWWNVLGVGIADMGSAWIRGDAAFEFNFDDVHQIRGLVNTLWGMGNQSLRPHRFKGYGNINHKSVDVGARYGYCMGYWGTVSVQYARRMYAYNFPSHTNLVLFEYYLPFGMQSHCRY